MPEIRDLTVQELTANGFSPYGTVIAPTEDGTPFGAADAALQLGGGTPRFYAMRLPNRGLVISHITRHRQVTQVLASAGGQPWLLAVAAPPDEDVAEARPALDDIRAFRIPGDAAIMLRRAAPGTRGRCSRRPMPASSTSNSATPTSPITGAAIWPSSMVLRFDWSRELASVPKSFAFCDETMARHTRLSADRFKY